MRLTSKLVRASWTEPMDVEALEPYLVPGMKTPGATIWEFKVQSHSGLLFYDGEWGYILKGDKNKRINMEEDVDRILQRMTGGDTQKAQLSQPIKFTRTHITVQDVTSGALERDLEAIKDPALRGPFLEFWATMNLEDPLGEGSSRKVFPIDDEHVLKIALNQAGAAQNRVEGWLSQIAKNLPITETKMVGRDNSYLVVERAEDFDNNNFYLEYKIPFMGFCMILANKRNWEVIQQWHQGAPVYRDSEGSLYLEKNQFVEAQVTQKAMGVMSAILQHGVSVGDVIRSDQWGDVGGESKLVDYGLNQDVWNTHYKTHR